MKPNVMTFLSWCSELHLALRGGDNNAVLVEARRHGVRVKYRADTVDEGALSSGLRNI
jgi:hypothetical protein